MNKGQLHWETIGKWLLLIIFLILIILFVIALKTRQFDLISGLKDIMLGG